MVELDVLIANASLPVAMTSTILVRRWKCSILVPGVPSLLMFDLDSYLNLVARVQFHCLNLAHLTFERFNPFKFCYIGIREGIDWPCGSILRNMICFSCLVVFSWKTNYLSTCSNSARQSPIAACGKLKMGSFSITQLPVGNNKLR